MYTVILCGGLGTRLSEETSQIPKPMVKIGNYPILFHIMRLYSKYKYKKFILSSGYKSEIIKNFFLNLNYNLDKDLKIKYKNNFKEIFLKKNFLDWDVNIFNTGLKSMTGARIKKLYKFLRKEENFFMTYGDGLSDVNFKDLYKFHISHGKVATMTAVRPLPRFGKLEISKNNIVNKFREKDQLTEGWINGGFFVLNKKIFDYIEDSENCVFEKKPLTQLSKAQQLMAYKHEGFWQPMDTLRDKLYLEKLEKSNNRPW
jgi:glucose-1-phosphate cytidylyltransferase